LANESNAVLGLTNSELDTFFPERLQGMENRSIFKDGLPF